MWSVFVLNPLFPADPDEICFFNVVTELSAEKHSSVGNAVRYTILFGATWLQLKACYWKF